MKPIKSVVSLFLAIVIVNPALAATSALNAESITEAVRRSSPQATAAEVLAAAGVSPGSYSADDVVKAFSSGLSEEKMQALLEQFQLNRLRDATVAGVAPMAVARDQYAGGPIIAAAAAVAFLLALSACATDRPVPVLRYGSCDRIALLWTNRACAQEASRLGYPRFQVTTWGCWGCY